MKKLLSVSLTVVMVSVLLTTTACASGQLAATEPVVTATAMPLVARSADWKVEIKSGNWGGSSPVIQVGADQQQLLVFANLEYIGPGGDVVVPAFGVKDDQGRNFDIFSSFGYGDIAPVGGADWISSFVSGNPATRHFVTGDAFQPLMFTFAGPKDAKSFLFFFDDLSIDFTSVIKSNS